MKIKNDVIQKTLDVIPTKDFFRDMVTFIKHPEIYDGENEYVPLKNAGANFFQITNSHNRNHYTHKMANA